MDSCQRVAYFYDGDVYTENIGNYYYGQGHPMKPHRVRMTHQLILEYGLSQHLDVYVIFIKRPHRATAEELMRFHSQSHISFLRSAESTGQKYFVQDHHIMHDCPIFENIYEFSQICAGGSIDCALAINQNEADICINWAGGLHHAKKQEASGFCYVNDIVLSILELLKYHNRVLYIDIDVHHGDGVEEAFYTTNRVMTVSFHKYGQFFPGTGDVYDIGDGRGKYYALNVPLNSGMTDDSYRSVFQPIISDVMYYYQPNAVILQCGADSIAYDKLGRFNLTLKGHGECVQFVKQFGIPMIVFGGGGYTIPNVSRCWAYETAICLGQELNNDIPPNDYFQYFGPSYKLHIPKNDHLEDDNTKEYLQTCVVRCCENLRKLEGAPGIPIHERPASFISEDLRSRKSKREPREFYH